MNFHQAIRSDNWDAFFSLIKQRVSLREIDETNGNTVLHSLAYKVDSNDVIGNFFARKKRVTDYFIEIAEHIGSSSIVDLALMQNHNMDTAMHVAITQGNWSLASHLGNRIVYFVSPEEKFRKNRYGLNEYELALILYGIWGKRDEIDKAFGYDGNILKRLMSFPDGLIELKKVLKSIKIVKPGSRTVILDRDDEFFSRAVEDEYPSHLATLEDGRKISLAEIHKLYVGRRVLD